MGAKSNWIAAAPVALFFLITAVGFGGCRTLPPASQGRETPRDVRDAVVSVSGAMAGHPLSETEARRLERQVVADPEAQRAVRTMTSSAEARGVKAKYCPAGGEHYAPSVEVCPIHKVHLLLLNNSK